jgi:hypothetical protein
MRYFHFAFTIAAVLATQGFARSMNVIAWCLLLGAFGAANGLVELLAGNPTWVEATAASVRTMCLLAPILYLFGPSPEQVELLVKQRKEQRLAKEAEMRQARTEQLPLP